MSTYQSEFSRLTLVLISRLNHQLTQAITLYWHLRHCPKKVVARVNELQSQTAILSGQFANWHN